MSKEGLGCNSGGVWETYSAPVCEQYGGTCNDKVLRSKL